MTLSGRKVSVGQAVKAMILNALGFRGRALYLNPRFYENRPVEQLIGKGVTAADLHDASLGTALDALYEYGITELFYRIASSVTRKLEIHTKFAHLDSTSFSVHGVYNSEEEEGEGPVVRIPKGETERQRTGVEPGGSSTDLCEPNEYSPVGGGVEREHQ